MQAGRPRAAPCISIGGRGRPGKDLIRLVWILPFRQFSGKGQFLTPARAAYRRKKKHRDRSPVLDFQLQISVVGRE
jgi:hypothetical protein